MYQLEHADKQQQAVAAYLDDLATQSVRLVYAAIQE
jgi:hypothetical protein